LVGAVCVHTEKAKDWTFELYAMQAIGEWWKMEIGESLGGDETTL